MSKLTNTTGIHPIMAVWLGHKDYSAPVAPRTLSVTTLLKPVRQIILSNRINKEESPVDVASLVKSQIGHAIHLAIENAWKTDLLPTTLQNLGYPQNVINKVRINPPTEDTSGIPLFFELRRERLINGWVISGQFDIVYEGILNDVKSTGTYTYTKGIKISDYAKQLGMYKWIDAGQPNPIIHEYYGLIHFVFTDYSNAMKATPKYPPSQVYTQKIDLPHENVIQSFILSKLDDLEEYWEAEEHTLPKCSEEDLWRSEPSWKYYKNPDKKARSTKNFDNYQEAMERLVEDGSVGVIDEVKGKVKACAYCPAFSICTQKDEYLLDGSLEL